jgi:hypothetical protein
MRLGRDYRLPSGSKERQAFIEGLPEASLSYVSS